MSSITASTKTYRQLDATDQKIVDYLREDGRTPYREIARRLGVTESMVRKRVNKLLNEGWMRIQAISDPLQLGVPILATTYAKVSPRFLDAITESIAANPAVRYVAIAVGSHNMVVESIHWNNNDLHEFLQTELAQEGILSSETMQVVKIKKSVWNWDVKTVHDSNT